MKNNIFNKPTVLRRANTLRTVVIFVIFSTFIFHLSKLSAQPLGSWQVYPSYTTATKVIPVGKRIYGLMESNLIAYDTEDASVTTFDCLRQLNDVTISLMEYCPEAKRMILVYDNSNIDLISTDDDDDVLNLAYIKQSNMQDNTVNGISMFGTTAYLATNFGIVCIDVAEGVILHTYNLGERVTAAASDGTYIFAGGTSGVWRGRMSDNLQDPASWTCIQTNIRLPQKMFFFDEHVFAISGSYLCWSPGNGQRFDAKLLYAPTSINVQSDCFIFAGSQRMDIFSAWNQSTSYQGNFTWNDVCRVGNTFWAADGSKGLQAYRLDGNDFTLTQAEIHPNSPLHSYSHHLRYTAGGRLLVSGGSMSYGYLTNPGTAMMLEPDGTWVNFDSQSAIDAAPDSRFINATDIAQDPQDPQHHYVGTATSGVYEFRNGTCVNHLSPSNSPLRSTLPNDAHPLWYVMCSSTKYDPDGNLWILNSAQDTIIRIMQPDGRWTSLYYSEINHVSAMDNIIFDRRGWAWMNSRRSTGRGLFCLNYGGTITTSSDDRHYLRSQIVNQDHTTYAPDYYYCMAEDLNGNIWLGTSEGPFLISAPEDFMDSDFRFEQVKVARQDGSGLADYLLAGLPITCITIDGGNRKWFGTLNNGVYLISDDCQEQIYHFTTDNSPLINNDINDIAINGETGQVMIATAKGLCSFMADASDGIDNPTDDDVIAYPNPVTPDYNGPIAIRGLAVGSDVKIVTSTGQIVWSGTSTGGMFTWNGCNASGRRVASGVYIVLSTQPNGKQAVATKIAFIH